MATVFAIFLAIVGLWSSRRRPWKDEKGRMVVAKAFMVAAMPLVVAEAVTGVLSLFANPLQVPPTVGLGMSVDLAILAIGVLFLLLRLKLTEGAEQEERTAQKHARDPASQR